MGFFSRIKNGWNLGLTSLQTISENPKLLAFPFISGIALVAACITFFGGFVLLFGVEYDQWAEQAFGEYMGYVVLFIFYLLCYFIIVFFNVGLVHCARRVFDGEEVGFRDGIEFASSRFTTILNWAVLAATVGVLMQILKERLGFLGQMISGLAGLAWSIATFFVVPILAYEDISPMDAVKRSAELMKSKWGEAIGANFGFGILFFLGYIVIAFVTVLLITMVNPVVGIVAGIVMALILHAALSAAEIVFITATYQHLHNDPVGRFDGDTLDSVFMPKR
ncbi:MAG: DUF6159 family protein [Bacteroidetes bacterium]|nr:DUF6159 family protein [Bacteroidota bacterium]